MAQVFISKSDTTSGTLAAKIAENLERSGISCWYSPRNITPGRAFDEDIVPAIRQCSVFLLLLTRDAQKSEHVARELNIVCRLNNDLCKQSRYDERRSIIVYQVEPLTLNDRFEYLLTGISPILGYLPGGEAEMYAAVRAALESRQDDPVNTTPAAVPEKTPGQGSVRGLGKKLGMALLWGLLLSLVYTMAEKLSVQLLTEALAGNIVFKSILLLVCAFLTHRIWKAIKKHKK